MRSLKKREKWGRGAKPDEVDESLTKYQVESLTVQNQLDEVEMRSMRSMSCLKTQKNVQRSFSNPCNTPHPTTHPLFSMRTVHTAASNPCNNTLHARTWEKLKEVIA